MPILSVIALAGCGGSRSVALPSNHGHLLDDALRRLHAAGLRATFAERSSPCGDRLPWVNVQAPRAPARVKKGAVIVLSLETDPIPSPVVPKVRSRWAYVPNLVGKDAAAADGLRAIWPCFHVRPAAATSAARLVVVAQHPAPHTRLPAYGVAVGRGWRPTTIDVYVAAR